MTARLQRFIHNLTGRSEATLVSFLLAQFDATLCAVDLAKQVAAGEVDAEEGSRRMGRIETDGDNARRDLIDELRRTLVSPMDREDLYRLSRSIDDVLDNLRDLAREFRLYGMANEPLLLNALDNLEAGVRGLYHATQCLLDRPHDAARQAAESKKNDVRRSYQEAMADLLAEARPVDTILLRRRELLRRIDITGLRLAEAADALADGAVKRSH